MTGDEHYREAERLIGEAQINRVEFLIAQAQVHATLALAAATAHPAERDGSWGRYYGTGVTP